MSEIKSTNKYLIKRKYKTIDGKTYPMDEYEVTLIEEDSEDCGYIKPQYQWSATTGFICDYETYTKYSRKVKMVSYDSGTTWSVVVPMEETTGEIVAYDSYDCGKPMYRCVETDESYCEDNSDDFKLAFFYKGNTSSSPDKTIPCADGIVDGDDKDYFTDYDDAKKVERVVVGDCVIEIKRFYWSYPIASLTVGNNVRKINARTIAYGMFGKYPITLPQSLVELYGGGDGITVDIMPLANPDNFQFSGSSAFYKLIVPYGTLTRWKNTLSSNGIKKYSIYQEEYKILNDDWKVKVMNQDSDEPRYLGDDGGNELTYNEAGEIAPPPYNINDGASITVASSVTSLGDYSLGQVWYSSVTLLSESMVSITSSPFKQLSSGSTYTKIYVPCSIIDSYVNDSRWGGYKALFYPIEEDCPYEPTPVQPTHRIVRQSGWSGNSQDFSSRASTAEIVLEFESCTKVHFNILTCGRYGRCCYTSIYAPDSDSTISFEHPCSGGGTERTWEGHDIYFTDMGKHTIKVIGRNSCDTSSRLATATFNFTVV